MKKLTHLIICGNGLRDISVITELPNLVYIEIQGNKIKDYSPLKSLPKGCKVVRHY